MIFESHAHYDDEAFKDDRTELIVKMKEAGIEYIINVAADLHSVETTYELAQKYDFIYAALGIHPSEVEPLKEEHISKMKELLSNKKAVAVGEIGLDYHYPEPTRELQKKWFIRQMELAKEIDKPVIIHSREAAADTMSVLTSKEMREIRGVVHCYSYTKETARTILDLGYYFGIGGVITFSNAKKLVETVEYLPLDRILLETDAPYLAPMPNRGQRNSSLNIPYIAEKIAQIKGISYDEVTEKTMQNAKELFFR